MSKIKARPSRRFLGKVNLVGISWLGFPGKNSNLVGISPAWDGTALSDCVLVDSILEGTALAGTVPDGTVPDDTAGRSVTGSGRARAGRACPRFSVPVSPPRAGGPQ